jgi:hypothetical protein
VPFVKHDQYPGKVSGCCKGDRKRQVIRDIIVYLIREHIVQDRASISAFLLTDTAMIVNGQKLPEGRHKQLQQLAGQEPVSSFRLNANEFFIYFGGPGRQGQGIYLGQDSLK